MIKCATMVSLHNYYLSIILELKCSTLLNLVVNYVATHTIKRFIDCVIHWKCKCRPLVGFGMVYYNVYEYVHINIIVYTLKNFLD